MHAKLISYNRKKMEFNFKTDKNSDMMSAINSVLGEIGHKDSESGIPVILEECEEGLVLTRNNDAFVIKYSSRSALMRSVGLLSENAKKKKVNITEKPVFSVIGTLLDNSRNAVYKIDIY